VCSCACAMGWRQQQVTTTTKQNKTKKTASHVMGLHNIVFLKPLEIIINFL
jgi:hypothetical protein